MCRSTVSSNLNKLFFLNVFVPPSLAEGSFSPSLLIWDGCIFAFELLVTLWDNGSSSALDETLPCPGLQPRMKHSTQALRGSFRMSLRMCRYVQRRQVSEVAVPMPLYD